MHAANAMRERCGLVHQVREHGGEIAAVRACAARGYTQREESGRQEQERGVHGRGVGHAVARREVSGGKGRGRSASARVVDDGDAA
jgi:hypothetical protein